jgi:trimeric autotransporter adhesin
MATITQRVLALFVTAVWLCSLATAQSVNSSEALLGAQASAVVPRLVNYSGRALDVEGKTISGTAGATFAIYSQQSGGAPLWMETQNVSSDSKGNFTAQLGAAKAGGLPQDLFSSGEARWLGVRINGGEEQPRVLLLSVPYALKAADAQTLGGLPASAFMLAGSVFSGSQPVATPAGENNAGISADVTGTGTTNFVPLWTNTTGTLGNSVLFQSGTGATAKMGINTTSPATTLDVNGSENVRGQLSMASTGAATAATGKNSQPQAFNASVFNSSTSTAVPQKFQWQAEPLNNNTASASSVMSLLYASGAATPADTGLKISSKGVLTFASGQTFPGTGKGTVTSVGLSVPTSDFTVSGSPVTGNGTLKFAWNFAPTSADTPNAIVKRDSNGSFDVTSISAQASNGGAAITGNDQSGGGSSGVFGNSSNGNGVYGQSSNGIGVQGLGGSSSFGVYGTGLTGVAGVSDGNYIGVYGTSNGSGSYGVFGLDGSNIGVYGSGAVGVEAISTGANAGIYAQTNGGWAVDAFGTDGGTGVLAGSDTGWAAWFNGNVNVDGNLSKAGGSFKIDHPLDPADKYLYHSFVESPDMMNIYNGNAELDANGEAVVQLPEWFGALNRDFRYQLTCIGGFAEVYIAKEISNNQFKIAGGKSGVKVSWQVTGVRQDAWANAHRIPVEEEKPQIERGTYLHPELFGAPKEKGVLSATAPQAMARWKQAEAKAPALGQGAPPKR